MAYYERDGFNELIERAIRQKRYDIIKEIIEARDKAEKEYLEALKCPQCGAIRRETPHGLFCPKCEQ
jgi:rubrerythrin